MQKTIFISWAPYCSRSDNIAREFGGLSYMVYFEELGSNYFTIWLKYLLQTLKSLKILFIIKPDIVFVMSPPVFACLPVLAYRLFNKKNIKLVIDAHTAAFTHKRWSGKDWLNRFFVSKSNIVIVTNENLGKTVTESWNGRYFIIPDVPVRFPEPGETPFLNNSQNKIITLINSFAPDEPLYNFITAAKKINGIEVYITGKTNRKKINALPDIPPNIRFTDFLSIEDYAALLKSSDLICAFTTRDNTMQRGAYEAIYLGKPVITSDWSILKNNFPTGTVFVDNSVEGMGHGINQALDKLTILTKEAENLRKEKIKRWQEIHKNLMSELEKN